MFASLAACSSGGGGRLATRAYSPPGNEDDPWGPYIRESSRRFDVPERWVRAVMQQESGGRAYIDGKPTTSWKGATGLMQVMPDTYAELASRYGLGSDPYNPRDNILAGTAYIKEMYDRFGSPGFLAAYNAGPARMDSYLADGGSLPEETRLYLASVAPRLGDERPGAGPLAAYAEATPPPPPSAPDPSRFPSATPPPQVALAVYIPAHTALGSASPALVTAADSPVPLSVPTPVLAPMPDPQLARPRPLSAAADAYTPAPSVRDVSFRSPAPRAPVLRLAAGPAYADERGTAGMWTVQVGAYGTPAQARAAADAARQSARLAGQPVVGSVEHGGTTLFRARITGLSAEAARAGCDHLRSSGLSCMIVPPEGA